MKRFPYSACIRIGIMYNKGTKAPHEWGKIDKELHVFLKIRKLS